ncbi:Leucine-rich repeat [Arabidopsis suecica]|uniref:Leucine-rich repeat n=1 Tax=Arabidopsis suecica TaxID=45249 RepID=A0A8T1XSI7_ARASU|nr:Leucine-rich repeat [Arabidopsis suecica]
MGKRKTTSKYRSSTPDLPEIDSNLSHNNDRSASPSHSDHTCFLKITTAVFLCVLVYVDDIIIASNNDAAVDELKAQLKSCFKLRDLGPLKYFLGLEIARSAAGIYVGQRKYALDLLDETGLLGCKPSSIPMDPSVKFSKETGGDFVDAKAYRRLIGRLMYLQITRPDIAFAVNKLSQFSEAPRQAHQRAVMKILHYIKGTIGLGLFYSSKAELQLQVFADADFQSCKDTRRSTNGYCMFLGSSLISWKSKKQQVVSKSSAEAEYRALSFATDELLWLDHFFKELQVPLSKPTLLWCDNTAAIHIANNSVFHERTKHIESDCHSVRERLVAGLFKLLHVNTHLQLADPFTKALYPSTFRNFAESNSRETTAFSIWWSQLPFECFWPFVWQNLKLHGFRSCIEKERKALLELKKFVMSRCEEQEHEYVLPSWTNDTKSDCCRWEDIKCNRTSKRVMSLSLYKLYFSESSLLNLSLLHPFEEVQSLDLSMSRFNGLVDDVEDYKSLRRLRNLQILNFSSNEFNNSIFPFLNAATSLTTLFLRNNYMYGPFPAKELKNLTNLELLDLKGNFLNGSMPVREFPYLKKLKALDLSSNRIYSSMEWQGLRNLTNLEVLSLGSNNYHSPEPIPIEVFCELKNLRELDLRENYFVGQLPLCFGSLNKLRFLDLSSNQLSGNIPPSFSSLESLEYLSLSDNSFEGFFSLSPLANLTKLKVFKMSSTSVMLQVETENNWQPKFQLSVVVLRLCSLEKIPNFLMYQKNLRLVDLSDNRLSGIIPAWLLENNPELEALQLKNNSFTIFQMPTTVHNLQVLDFSENDIGGLFPDNIGRVIPNLVHMNGSNNGFQGNFPSSIDEMKNISFLDLSYNNLSGELPQSFVSGCFSLRILQLSHNKFSGHFLPRGTNFTSLFVLRINNNLFTGKIGFGLLTLVDLNILDMSNNFLEGALPPSILVLEHLTFLDLSANLLSGALPPLVGSLFWSSVFLHNNNFTGPIPDILLESVHILDLRNNKLSGNIPQFVNTQDMSILLLRGNNLTGFIPRELCELINIRLLDLSNNKLNGFIPSCLNNLSFGPGGNEDNFFYLGALSPLENFYLGLYKSTFGVEDFRLDYRTHLKIEIQFAAKHRYDSYTGAFELTEGILDYMYGLDLSSNELSGVIPAELGELSKLRALNLSRNFLSSHIPDSFSKLEDMESLDLSYNMLHGSIPHQLTNLTSLAVFNVSYNNLSGIIPQGRQFNTFDENSYLGNPLLCGPPTDRSCEAKKNSEEIDNGGEEDDDEGAIDMLVFYWSTAATYVTALISILVLMCVDCSWRRAWLRLVDAFIASAKSKVS